MYNLALYCAPQSAEDLKELDPTDSRLGDLAQFADRRDAESVRQLSQALLNEGYFDIRVLTFWMWSAFAQQGPVVLPLAFQVLAAAATVNFEVLSPSRRREEHLIRRVIWFCQRSTEGLEYHEKKLTPEWLRWRAQLSNSIIEEGIDELNTLASDAAPRAAVVDKVTPMDQAVAQLAAQLRSVARSLKAELPPVEPSSPQSGAAAPSVPGPDSFPEGIDPLTAPVAALPPGLVALRPSHHFFELIAKLDAFRKLVAKKDWTKAAIVSDDVTRLIEEFDPRLYFPQLFSDYSESMSDHVEELANQWRERDSLAWKTALQFYRVDLRRFVGG